MSDFLNLSAFSNSSQYSRISLALSGILSPGSPPPINDSSVVSNLTSLLTDRDHLEQTSTPIPMINYSNSTENLPNPIVKPVKLQYAVDLTPDILKGTYPDSHRPNHINYNGRNLLDLASNIIPYSWQQQTPLSDNELGKDKNSNVIADEEVLHDYPIKYCINCGFCQPATSA